MVTALHCGAATAYVRLSVVAMRARPSHAAEQVSQALMGTPVEVLEAGDDWSRVRTPDGYQGWIINHSLAHPSEAWIAAPKVMITDPYEQHDADCKTDLVCGDVLAQFGDSLMLPDGRKILAPQGIKALAEIKAQKFRPEELPRFAEQYLGVPYLWGGMSSKGMDCSGLVRMAYWAQGRIIPRDASQQAREGIEVAEEALQPGDLLFFGNPRTEKVTHVAIYDRDGEYIHASQLVRRNSLRPSSPIYLPLHLLHIRRI